MASLTTWGDFQWLTEHDASTEHDVAAGLREHIDAKKRWRSAIASARAVHRFGKHCRASSASSTGSGGWGRDHLCPDAEGVGNEAPSHDGSPTDASESFTKLSLGSSDPGTNINVKITGPEEGETEEKGEAGVFSSADDSLTGGSEVGLNEEESLRAQASSRTGESLGQLAGSAVKRAGSIPAKNPSPDRVVNVTPSETEGSDEPELRMPGTFLLANADEEWSQGTTSRTKLAEALRKLGLFTS